MAETKRFHPQDMEAHMRHLQEQQNDEPETSTENGDDSRVRLDGGGYYDTEIYESRSNKYTHYNQSIAVDDAEDEEEEVSMPVLGRKSGFAAPHLFMKDTVDKDHDPMAQYKRPTIADREDDYRARRRAQVLSPDRIDPFMDALQQSSPNTRASLCLLA